MQALISYVAQQPEAQLDSAGDPRVGMSGASYGGGIQLVTAAIDSRARRDRAGHRLALARHQPLQGAVAEVRLGLGAVRAGRRGRHDPGIPAGETGNLDPHITSAYTSGLAYGQFSDEDVQWFASRGPGALVDRIRIPTLLIQGTADTLFTLDEATTNYKILRANNVPTKMIWFCGGHGACLTDGGPALWVEQQTVRWFERYLKGDTSVSTGTAVRVDRRRRPGAQRRVLPAAGAATSGRGGLRACSP